MHEASAMLVGGTFTAVDEVMSGRARHALNLGGGLHHGFRGRASGFCVYNDSSVAIKYLQEKFGARVFILIPMRTTGTGFNGVFMMIRMFVHYLSMKQDAIYSQGLVILQKEETANGFGTSFNFPVDAFTEDESFLEIYRTAITEIAEHFKPDVILTQNGADAHYLDPFTHLYGTMNIYKEIPRIAREVAEQYCEGRWIAVGGGGYDIWRVVPGLGHIFGLR